MSEKQVKNKIYINGKLEISEKELFFFPIARSEKGTQIKK